MAAPETGSVRLWGVTSRRRPRGHTPEDVAARTPPQVRRTPWLGIATVAAVVVLGIVGRAFRPDVLLVVTQVAGTTLVGYLAVALLPSLAVAGWVAARRTGTATAPPLPEDSRRRVFRLVARAVALLATVAAVALYPGKRGGDEYTADLGALPPDWRDAYETAAYVGIGSVVALLFLSMFFATRFLRAHEPPGWRRQLTPVVAVLVVGGCVAGGFGFLVDGEAPTPAQTAAHVSDDPGYVFDDPSHFVASTALECGALSAELGLPELAHCRHAARVDLTGPAGPSSIWVVDFLTQQWAQDAGAAAEASPPDPRPGTTTTAEGRDALNDDGTLTVASAVLGRAVVFATAATADPDRQAVLFLLSLNQFGEL